MVGKPACVVVCVIVASSSQAVAQNSRFELFAEPDVRQASNHRVSSAYVVDKKDNQFWVCTARYNFPAKEPNKGECAKLPNDIGRPSLSESYRSHAVVGT